MFQKFFLMLFLFISVSVGIASQKITYSEHKHNVILSLFYDVKDLTHSIILNKNLTSKEKNVLYKVIKKKLGLIKKILTNKEVPDNFYMKFYGHPQNLGISTNLKCSLCNGSGVHNGKTCPACNGDGYAWSPDPKDDCVKCGRCGGSGVLTGGEVCPGCGGSGWANAHPDSPGP